MSSNNKFLSIIFCQQGYLGLQHNLLVTTLFLSKNRYVSDVFGMLIPEVACSKKKYNIIDVDDKDGRICHPHSELVTISSRTVATNIGLAVI